MSKRSNAAALKAYPPIYTTVKRHAKRVQSELVDTHEPARAIFQQGYEKAEKDLALTWEDVKNLDYLLHDVDFENGRAVSLGKEIPFDGDEGFYGEVLKRFNEQRKK